MVTPFNSANNVKLVIIIAINEVLYMYYFYHPESFCIASRQAAGSSNIKPSTLSASATRHTVIGNRVPRMVVFRRFFRADNVKKSYGTVHC